ncbi:hypothetical protein WJX72_005627 [[Myrmecia] bisecta]|uniref:Uncharacterized protein n=1 Tax=[Myrmecia] bisecta TaxID=41462 RepID=A0AAW1PG57_9CHLO
MHPYQDHEQQAGYDHPAYRQQRDALHPQPPDGNHRRNQGISGEGNLDSFLAEHQRYHAPQDLAQQHFADGHRQYRPDAQGLPGARKPPRSAHDQLHELQQAMEEQQYGDHPAALPHQFDDMPGMARLHHNQLEQLQEILEQRQSLERSLPRNAVQMSPSALIAQAASLAPASPALPLQLQAVLHPLANRQGLLSLPMLQNAQPQQQQPQQGQQQAQQDQQQQPGAGATSVAGSVFMAAGTSEFAHCTLEELRQAQSRFAEEREWTQFHTPRNLLLAMVGEVGELSELFQWRPEEAGRGLPGFTQAEKSDVADELSDVLLYLIRMADVCGIDLANAVKLKIQKNTRKYPPEQCRGSHRKYTAYQTGPASAPPAPKYKTQTSTPVGEGANVKRRRFTEEQVTALQELAERMQWSLHALSKEVKEAFCEKWDISKDRLHNFFNNRKPKDLKRGRSGVQDKGQSPSGAQKQARTEAGEDHTSQPSSAAPPAREVSTDLTDGQEPQQLAL